VDTRQAVGTGQTTLEAELRSAHDRQAASFEDQVAAEGAEGVGVAAEAARLRARVAGLDAEIRSLEDQRDLQSERVNVSRERLRAASDLRARGLISETEYRAREDTWLAQRQAVASLDQQIVARQHERVQISDQLSQAGAESADRLTRLRTAAAELRQKGVEIAVRGTHVVVAPAPGRVTALQASAGEAIDPARPVLTLFPTGSALGAELFLPSRAIGFVVAGQPVRLMFDAFPYQRFGAYAGTFDSVSEALIGPNCEYAPTQDPTRSG
jgi:membrane fusion protein